MEIKSILGEKVLIEWRKMQSLQPDNLKLPYNIAHLKKSLLENNFAMPFFGWQNGSEVFTIDGHQRKEVLMELEGEGVKVPELLDCQLIKAKDRKEAVKLLLSVFNQKSNPIDLEVLTEWINIEQVEVEVVSLNVIDLGHQNYSLGHEANSMNDEDIDLTEDFDPIGNSSGLQRVVFIFDGSEEAESYLKSLNVQYKKMNMAWQVNLSTQYIL